MPSGKPKHTWSLITRVRFGLILLFMPVLLLGGVYYLHLKQTLRSELQNSLIATNNQYFHAVLTPYLGSLERQFSLIYKKVNYQDFIGPRVENPQRYLQSWRVFLDVMELQYIYIGTEQRQMLIHPAWQADDKFDPRNRPWYQLAAQHPDKMVWTAPYYDYTYGTLVIALARAILDPAGRRVGVLSLDTRLAQLSSWLNPRDHIPDEHYQMLINRAGMVLVHPDQKQVFQPLTHPEWMAKLNNTSGFFLDSASGLMVAYHQIPQLDGFLLSVEPTSNLQQVIDRVSTNVVLMICLASMLYLVLAVRWSIYFQRMLTEITGLIRASRTGTQASQRKRMIELDHVYQEMAAASHDFAQIRQQANQDKLTELYNRRFFDECLQQQIDLNQPICLVMFDLDNFKRVNDTYGHQTGDVVLKRVSKLGFTLFHEWGWFCRYGGEELVLIFRMDEPGDLLTSLLEAFRHGVEQLDWREAELTVSISGGAAFSDGKLDAKTLIELADAEVYRAKREGKNRICFPQCSPAETKDHSPLPATQA